MKEEALLHSFSWDEYFMTMAYLVSMKSKDPSTRVGAVIVGPDREVRATGYNGLPRMVEDKASRYNNRDYKLLAINHAEENAILNCALNGIAARGCVLYSPWMPCSSCTKLIIQSGIKEVVYDSNFPGNHEDKQHDWSFSMNVTAELLAESGIVMRAFSGGTIKIEGLYHGSRFELPKAVSMDIMAQNQTTANE